MNRINQENINRLSKDTTKTLLEFVKIQELQWKRAIERPDNKYFVYRTNEFIEKERVYGIRLSNVNLWSHGGEAICRYFRSFIVPCGSACVYDNSKCRNFLDLVNRTQNKRIAFIDAGILRNRLNKHLEELDE